MPRDLATANAVRISPSLMTTAVTVAPEMTSTCLEDASRDMSMMLRPRVTGDEAEQLVGRYADQQDRFVMLNHLRAGDGSLGVDPRNDTDGLAGVPNVGCLEDVADDGSVSVCGDGGRNAFHWAEALCAGENLVRLDVGLVGAKPGGADRVSAYTGQETNRDHAAQQQHQNADDFVPAVLHESLSRRGRLQYLCDRALHA